MFFSAWLDGPMLSLSLSFLLLSGYYACIFIHIYT